VRASNRSTTPKAAVRKSHSPIRTTPNHEKAPPAKIWQNMDG